MDSIPKDVVEHVCFICQARGCWKESGTGRFTCQKCGSELIHPGHKIHENENEKN